MKIEEYHLIQDTSAGWRFPNVKLDRINLIVGDSGTGKSRFINTICNFSLQAVANKVEFDGEWIFKILVKDKHYKWSVVIGNEGNEHAVLSESLVEIIKNEENQIVKRTKDSFVFKGQNLPKLSKIMTSIAILKDEEEIADIYNGFKKVITKRFYNDELLASFNIITLGRDAVGKYKKSKNLAGLINENIGFHNKILLLREITPEKYEELISFYKEVFPFIQDFDFFDSTEAFADRSSDIRTKVFCFREKNLENWIPVNDISTGMQKIFSIALDLFLLPEGGIMLLDEYENSLGINALNVTPDLIMTMNPNWQFIISSHHPYIINGIPIENWFVFHRKGTEVKIKTGEKLKEDYGKSAQEYFIQLINDPFFKGGIE